MNTYLFTGDHMKREKINRQQQHLVVYESFINGTVQLRGFNLFLARFCLCFGTN